MMASLDPRNDPAVGPLLQDTAETVSDTPSILDSLRGVRDEVASRGRPRMKADIRPDLYHGRLLVVFEYPEDGYERVNQSVRREITAKTAEERFAGSASVVLAATAAVLGRDEHGQLVSLPDEAPLDTDADGLPVELPATPLRFDKGLAEALCIEIPPEVKRVGLHVIRHVFSPRAHIDGRYDGDLAIVAMSNEVFGWLTGGQQKDAEDTLGE